MRAGAKSRTHGPILAVTEAAYRMDVDSQAWLDGLVVAAAPLLDAGLGVCGWLGTDDPSADTCSAPTTSYSGPYGDLAELGERLCRPLFAHGQRWSESGEMVVEIGERLPELRALALRCSAGRVRDVTGPWIAEPRGPGLALLGLRAAPGIGVDARRTWRRLVPHLAAGLRLRRTTARSEALREAVLASDRMRTPRPDDRERALAALQAVVSGRMVAVDRFESEGRRFMVALPLGGRGHSPLGLRAKERAVLALAARGHANKHIAATLGLEASTVATHLATGMRKLGIGSRVELAAWNGVLAS